MADFYAGGIVYEIRVDDKSGVGIARAEGNLKKFEDETNKTGTNLKSLSRDTSILGGSLASLGGTAMVAGTAIGGDFGSGLQSAGMGVAFVGSGVSTLVPALKTLAVITAGQVTPALVGLGTAAYVALGPIGLAALAVGGIVTAYAALKLAAPEDHFKTVTRSAEENKAAMDKLNDSYKDYLDLQKELKGIPESLEDIRRDMKGLDLDIAELNKEIAERPGTLAGKRTDLGLAALAAGESYKAAQKGGDPLQIATTKRNFDLAMSAVAENEKTIAGEDPELAKLLHRLDVMQDRREDYVNKETEILERGKALPGIIQGANAEVAMSGLSLGATPYQGEMRQFQPNIRPGAQMGVTGGTTPQFGDINIHIHGTVKDEVIKIPGSTLQDQTSAQGYTW